MSFVTDVDECRQGFCQGGQCTNTPGSFTCQCPVGFDVSSDGRLCIGKCRFYVFLILAYLLYSTFKKLKLGLLKFLNGIILNNYILYVSVLSVSNL